VVKLYSEIEGKDIHGVVRNSGGFSASYEENRGLEMKKVH